MRRGVTAAPPDALRLLLFGPPTLLAAEGERVAGVSGGKPLAMLAYLAVRGSATRAELLGLLWGELDESRARNALRQTLHRLRGSLEGLIESRGEELGLAAGAALWCDVSAYESALGEGRQREAVDLYGGDFLTGFDVGEPSFSHWADAQRARLRARQQTALEQVAREALDAGELEEAARRAGELTTIAPLDGNAAVLEATALAAQGCRAEAAAVLRRHAGAVESELGAEPAAAVLDLLAHLSGRSAGRGDQVLAGGEAPARTERPARNGEAPAGRATAPALVGREAELGRVLAEWRRVQGGSGATVVITGPPGIGRTRLLDEFAGRVSGLGPVLVLRGSGAAGGTRVPYAELAQALQPLLQAPGLAGASTHLLAEAARLLPQLRDRYDLPEPGPVADDASRVRFLEGVAAMLEAVAYEIPLCLMIDDVDRVSPATLDLLEYLSMRLHGSAVLVAVTSTSGAPAPSRWPHATVLEVGPLAEEDAAALARVELARAGGDPAEAGRVARLGGGHPVRIREAARRVAAGAGTAAPPARLRDVLTAVYAGCSAPERRVMTAAALLGRAVELPLLAAAAHLPAAAAHAAVESLASRDLLSADGAGIAPAHADAVDVALEPLGESARTMFAGWAADAALAHGGVADAVLADLFAQADRPAETCVHAHRAGMAAAAAGAFTEAADRFAQARLYAPDEATRADLDRLLEGLGHRPTRRLDAAAGGADPEGGEPRGMGTGGERRRTQVRWPLAAGLALAVVAAFAAVVWLLLPEPAPVLRAGLLQDTLLLRSGVGLGGEDLFAVTGDIDAARPVRWTGSTDGPEWLGDVQLPWMNPLPSPGGRHVALERATGEGTRLYVISAGGRDTVALATGPGDLLGLDWSPDGAALLVLHGRVDADGYRTDLLRYDVRGRELMPLDTTGTRDVTTGAWSPAGLSIAWLARSPGGGHALLASDADGGNRRVLARDIADGQALAWLPHGTHIAYVDEADGARHLFMIDIGSGAVRRLTYSPPDPRRPVFSPDGRFLAFEAGGGAGHAVYVVGAFGGEPRPVADAVEGFTLAGWRGPAPSYLDRLHLVTPALDAAGDRHPLELLALDQHGEPMMPGEVRVAGLDDSVAHAVRRATGAEEDPASAWDVVARRPGIARLVLSAGGWRADTGFVRVGRSALPLIEERFGGGSWRGRWRLFNGAGSPPSRDGDGIALGGAEDQDAGLLSMTRLPLRYGLDAGATVRLPGGSGPGQGRFTFALAPAGSAEQGDGAPPGLHPIAAVHWLGESGRLAYSVGREVRTEPLAAPGGTIELRVRIEVGEDGAVRFIVNDSVRWEPGTRIAAPAAAQLWIGGRSAGEPLLLRSAHAVLPAR